MVESLRAAERRLQAAQLASDVDALAVLIDDAALFTGPDGALVTKAEDLAGHASGRQVLNRLDEEDLRVLVVGDTGVTWFLGAVQVTVDGHVVTARLRYTRTWVNSAAGWRVVAAQATLVQ